MSNEVERTPSYNLVDRDTSACHPSLKPGGSLVRRRANHRSVLLPRKSLSGINLSNFFIVQSQLWASPWTLVRTNKEIQSLLLLFTMIFFFQFYSSTLYILSFFWCFKNYRRLMNKLCVRQVYLDWLGSFISFSSFFLVGTITGQTFYMITATLIRASLFFSCHRLVPL